MVNIVRENNAKFMEEILCVVNIFLLYLYFYYELTDSSGTSFPFGNFLPLDFAMVRKIFIASSSLPAATR